MGLFSDLRDARARASADKFESQKSQYLGDVWDAARNAVESEYRARLERVEAERDELAQRVELLEAQIRELEVRTVTAHSPAPSPPKAIKPTHTSSVPAIKNAPPTSVVHRNAADQIRHQHPKETDGLKLHRDGRLGPSSYKEHGLDVWYTVGADGTLVYYYREERTRPPLEWRDRWWGLEKRLEVIEKTLYRHDIPLVANVDQGKRIVVQKNRFGHKGDARKKAAIHTLCDAALAEARLVLDAGEEFYELDETARYAYATHLARRVGYKHNQSLDDGVGPAWQATYPILDNTNYLHCCLLESLCEGGAKGMVIPKSLLVNNIGARTECVRIVRELGLRFTMLAQLDSKDLEQAGIETRGDSLNLFYDLAKNCFVKMCWEGNALSFVPVSVDMQREDDVSFVGDTKARIFVKGASYRNAYNSLVALAAANDQVQLCGAYQYTKGDMHDSTWDHDYYFVRGNSPHDFGVHMKDDNEWETYTLHSVNALSPNRSYDYFYVRICDTFLKAWVQRPSSDEETCDVLGIGATVLFAPIGTSSSIDAKAQEALRSLAL